MSKVPKLNNLIQRAVVLLEGPIIEATDLDIQMRLPYMPEFGAGEQDLIAESRPTMSLEGYFEHFVLPHQDQIDETELSRRLGLNRKSVLKRRKMTKHPRAQINLI